MKIFACILVALLCSSCTTHLITKEQLAKEASPVHPIFGYYKSNATYISYVGSDEQYDYYYKSYPYSSKRFKVLTEQDKMYPNPIAFKGWLNCSQYIISRYRGRIILTSVKDRIKLEKYDSSVVAPEVRRLAKKYPPSDDNMEYSTDKETPYRRNRRLYLTKKCLTMLNDWTIKNLHQDRLNIPDENGKLHPIEWDIVPAHGRYRKKYSFTNWDIDARF